MIDLIRYLTGKSNIDAARELADMLGVRAGGSSRGSSSKANKAEPRRQRTPASRRRNSRRARRRTKMTSPPL